MLLPFSSVAAMFIGAAAARSGWRRTRQTAKPILIPLASGLIAGEAIMAVIVPVLDILHIGKG